MSRSQLNSEVGLYGKIPAFSDFVVRNLDGEFVDSWDIWLQDGMDNSRQVLGSAWQDHYVGAPVWRFVIGPGIMGDTAWVGIVMPSVDRVGRYFPLTLVQPMNPDIDITTTYLANCDWFRSVEQLGADALARDLDFKNFESRMSEFPAPLVVVDINAGDVTIPMLKTTFISCYFSLRLDGSEGGCISQVRDAISGTHRPTSLWGTECTYTQEHMLLASEELPDKEKFCALLDKNFAAHGWIEAPKLYAANCLPGNA